MAPADPRRLARRLALLEALHDATGPVAWVEAIDAALSRERELALLEAARLVAREGRCWQRDGLYGDAEAARYLAEGIRALARGGRK